MDVSQGDSTIVTIVDVYRWCTCSNRCNFIFQNVVKTWDKTEFLSYNISIRKGWVQHKVRGESYRNRRKRRV